MERRKFLAHGRGAALHLPLLAFSAHAQQRRSPSLSKSLISDLEKQIPEWMQEARVPGLSIAIIQEAKVVWLRGFGFKDAASKHPVNDQTIFEAASMSKPVFAYAVLKLCERGVMDLDTPLTRYTSHRILDDPGLELITARHVLSHTSGLQNWRSEEVPLKIHFPPGEKYLYSGEGYSYLQSVVAELTGSDIESYLKANLFAPFQMDSSGYVWSTTFAKRMARPHDRHGSPTENRKSTAADVARYGAAGALLTTPADFARFLLEIISPRPTDTFRLNRASHGAMLRPHVKVEIAKEYSIYWGLGWRIAHTKARHAINHGGDNPGFHCFAEASLEKHSGFVIMTNGENGGQLLKELAPAVAFRMT